MFLEAQGFTISNNILEQDNQSAIRLETNGRTSAGPKSRHIDIRYFWMKDRVKAAGVKIRHCPTWRMLADFFTKPLQGNLFRTLRDVLMGHKHVTTLEQGPPPADEERVGKQERPDGQRTRHPGYNRETSEVKWKDMKNVKENESLKVTWADVVRGTNRPTQQVANSKRVVSSSFSRNNPISEI
ncbi:hypothetical protein MHU86_8113 [Fragilaria crotonensis]|nr:hypothetical protein MHU86_8113 [Fragilaria crotonensis]